MTTLAMSLRIVYLKLEGGSENTEGEWHDVEREDSCPKLSRAVSLDLSQRFQPAQRHLVLSFRPYEVYILVLTPLIDESNATVAILHSCLYIDTLI